MRDIVNLLVLWIKVKTIWLQIGPQPWALEPNAGIWALGFEKGFGSLNWNLSLGDEI